MTPQLPDVLRLQPQYRDYVWGGRERLRPGRLTAEAWIVYEHDLVAEGPLAGQTLGQVAADYGAALLGRRAIVRTGTRFPLLIKLLDCAAWLSVQVHPNDEQARRLEGEGHFGKTEAWHILAADPGATLIAGIKAGTRAADLARAIRDGRVIDLCCYFPTQAGDTIFMRAGTIHALGPGVFLYEVQQTSDLTYRVYDWGRPATPDRPLHIDKSIAVTDPSLVGVPIPLPDVEGTARLALCHSEYFTLEMLTSSDRPMELDTGDESFHALTIIEGEVRVIVHHRHYHVGRLETALVPAATGAYRLEPVGHFRALKATL